MQWEDEDNLIKKVVFIFSNINISLQILILAGLLVLTVSRRSEVNVVTLRNSHAGVHGPKN